MLFLKIENPGAAAAESFTLFGATSKRNSDDDRMIGTFGSGSKHAVNLMLRENVNPTIFCGSLKLSFFTKPVAVAGLNDTTRTHHRVCVAMSGKDGDKTRNRTDELSVTLDYGTNDWTNVALGLREFVSNAIDACYEQGLSHKEVVVEIVQENQVRAKAGTTRIFVPVTPDVQNFYNNLGRWFLHFSEPESLGKSVLNKNGRNMPKPISHEVTKRPCVYRRGVFVREFRSGDKPSLFDYNLNDLALNESRTFNDWEAKHEIGKAIAKADAPILARVFKAMIDGEQIFEGMLDGDGMTLKYEDKKVQESARINWQKAFELVGGTNACLTATGLLADRIRGKGYKPVVFTSGGGGWMVAALENGLRSDAIILTDDEREGTTFSDPTDDVLWSLALIWETCREYSVLNDKAPPTPRCFNKPVQEGSQTFGFQTGNTVNIHEMLSVGKNEHLVEVMLEEVVHYITGATDFSRDFQQYVMRLCAKLILKHCQKS